MNWVRRLSSGQEVSYNDLPFSEVKALAGALDEWEIIFNRRRLGSSTPRRFHDMINFIEI